MRDFFFFFFVYWFWWMFDAALRCPVTVKRRIDEWTGIETEEVIKLIGVWLKRFLRLENVGIYSCNQVFFSLSPTASWSSWSLSRYLNIIRSEEVDRENEETNSINGWRLIQMISEQAIRKREAEKRKENGCFVSVLISRQRVIQTDEV